MEQQQQTMRIRALRGFRATVGGAFGQVNPGDVVDLSRDEAITVVSTKRGERVDDRQVECRREKNYLPERKRVSLEGRLAAARANVAQLESELGIDRAKPADVEKAGGKKA